MIHQYNGSILSKHKNEKLNKTHQVFATTQMFTLRKAEKQI